MSIFIKQLAGVNGVESQNGGLDMLRFKYHFDVERSLRVLLEPKSSIERITETVALVGTSPTRTINYVIRTSGGNNAPGELEQTLLFPIAAPLCGDEQPTATFAHAETQIEPIPYQEARLWEAIVLAQISCALRKSSDISDPLVNDCLRLIEQARTDIASRRRISRSRMKRDAIGFDSELRPLDYEDIEVMASELASRNAMLAIGSYPATISLINFLAAHLVTFVPIQNSRGRREHVTAVVPLDIHPDQFRLRARARTAMGFEPYILRLETPAVRIAQDYQLQVLAPTNSYVRYQGWVAEDIKTTIRTTFVHTERSVLPPNETSDLEDYSVIESTGIERLVPVRNDWFTNESPKPNFTDSLSSSSSCAALEWSGPIPRSPVYAFVVFNEKPPGGTMRQTALYTVLCLITLMTGAAIFQQLVTLASINVEAAILLFTLPGTVALWLRPRREKDGLSDPPLISSVAAFAVGFVAYASGIIFLWSNALTVSRCAHRTQCLKTSYPTYVFGLKANWSNPSFFSLGKYIVTGQLLIGVLVSCVALIVVYLAIRAMSSSRTYRKTLRGELPRLPPQLLRNEG